MKQVRRFIEVKGIVQGVGFRPFVYNLAQKYNLKGWVKNTTEGVEIDIEARKGKLEDFIVDLEFQAPPLAQIDNIVVQDLEPKGYNSFSIKESKSSSNTLTLISPDVSICEECRAEIKEVNNRRYNYPFTNCTNCGPRFSIIKSLPYDRPQTTMESFKMCDECSIEYNDPEDRRFHAQPNACPNCGPKVYLIDKRGVEIEVENPLQKTRELLKNGEIVVVKGLGGFHLVCDATQEDVIQRLRNRKGRPHKPLAVMMESLEAVKNYCNVSQAEENILQGIRKPILLLDKITDSLPENLAPNNHRLGVMLPYTPLHQLLFDQELEILVMTSANISGLPIEYKNEEVKKHLGEVADYFLLHNRDIHLAVDDSVARVVLGEERFIRRSRGYAPMPIKIKGLQDSLACGANFKNTFCISKGDFAFFSQHIGDLDNLETYDNFRRNINHFLDVYQVEPEIVAHDLHPDFLSTKYAQQQSNKRIAVQHHHAHIVSCMAENKVDKKVIGLAFDGTGLGLDDNIWGGEFLVCDYTEFIRVGHLNYIKMPGGDQAVKEPWRMAISHLFRLFGEEVDLDKFNEISNLKINNIIKMLKHNLNSPQTSSMGRLFDAVSALIDLRKVTTYQAQAAIELEAIAIPKEDGFYNYKINEVNGTYIINTDHIIKDIIRDLESQVEQGIIAKRFHNTVIEFSVEMCKLIRNKYEIKSVALSGGVFQNEIILTKIYNRLLEADFKVYTHAQVPCNDAGLALGQLVIANYRGEE